jgi:hypothetical protein
MVVDVKDNKNPNLIHTNNNNKKASTMDDERADMTSVAQLPICACRDKYQFPELPTCLLWRSFAGLPTMCNRQLQIPQKTRKAMPCHAPL